MHAILTFHSIDDKGSVISYSPGHFRLLLEVLARQQIPVLDLDTLLAPGTRKGVAITFDDGISRASTCWHAPRRWKTWSCR